MLTNSEINAIRGSWINVAGNSSAAGAAFYDELFRIAPQVRSMFPDSIDAQSRKLMETLAVVVDSLDDFQSLIPIVEELGRRHVTYGARPEHYGVVGTALITALSQFGGSSFDNAAKEAWKKAFSALSATMIAASK